MGKFDPLFLNHSTFGDDEVLIDCLGPKGKEVGNRKSDFTAAFLKQIRETGNSLDQLSKRWDPARPSINIQHETLHVSQDSGVSISEHDELSVTSPASVLREASKGLVNFLKLDESALPFQNGTQLLSLQNPQCSTFEKECQVATMRIKPCATCLS